MRLPSDTVASTNLYLKELKMTELKDGDFCYSKDGEWFNHDCFEEAAEEAKEDGKDIVYRGECVTIDPIGFFDAEDLIELIRERAYDNSHPDAAEDYLWDVAKEDIEKLDVEMKKLLTKWFDETGNRPRFYNVTNVVELDLNGSAVPEESK